MVWLTVLGVLVVVINYIVLTRRTKRMLVITPRQPLQEVKLVSVAQARAMIDDFIVKGDKFFVEPADRTAPRLEQLGPITREFFSRYGALRTRCGGFQLAAAEVRASEYVRGYLSIGHSEDWDVVQWPGSDEVFVVEGAETCEANMDVRFPSVYHLILDETQWA
jgi:hypothetical protein